MSDQSVSEAAIHTKYNKQTEENLSLSGIRTCNPTNRTAADLLLRPHATWIGTYTFGSLKQIYVI